MIRVRNCDTAVSKDEIALPRCSPLRRLTSTSGQRAKRKAPSPFAKCPTSLVAGARYAQRCPVEFGVPMDVVIAARIRKTRELR